MLQSDCLTPEPALKRRTVHKSRRVEGASGAPKADKAEHLYYESIGCDAGSVANPGFSARSVRGRRAYRALAQHRGRYS